MAYIFFIPVPGKEYLLPGYRLSAGAIIDLPCSTHEDVFLMNCECGEASSHERDAVCSTCAMNSVMKDEG
jgi:hypothetical protein